MIGKRPYLGKSRKEIREAILKKQVQVKEKEIPAGYSKEAANFVNACLQRQASKRLGINGPSEVKNHPWFKDFDWEALKTKQIKPSFVPDITLNNFDDNHVNKRAWNDTEDIQINEAILRRESQKAVFDNYYFDKQ